MSSRAAEATSQVVATTKRPRRRFSFWRFTALLALALLLFGGTLGGWGYVQFEKDLPDRWSALTDYHPSRASRVFSADGELIGEFYLQKRIVLPPEQIPRHLKLAFVAAEDNRFFDHHGLDPMGIARAAIANLRAGHIVQGGSTITQQVAKLMLLNNERNVFRKIREAILAHKIEQKLTKDQIISIYLNHVYLGHGAYGVQAAAEVYFAKDAKDLTIAEAALLAGLPKAPTEDSPFSSFPRARDRQRYVLGQMVENKFVSEADAAAARKETIAIISKDAPLNHIAAPYFVEHVRRLVQAKYGGKDLYDRGLHITTTLVMNQQRAAEAAVRHGLEDLDRRFGFRGPVGRLDVEERLAFANGLPREWSGHDPTSATKGPKGLPVAGALVPGKPYLALVEWKAKHPFARLGAVRIPFDEPDAARLSHWLEHAGNKLDAGDLIPVRVATRDRPAAHHGKHGDLTQVAEIAQVPTVQGALIAVDPSSGHMTAMVGGYDYGVSQFNRATQAHRQAGSSIKPYIYSAALEHGFTELSIVLDAPITIHTAAGMWSPHNYKAEYLGAITLRTALQKSINTVSVRLVAALGVDKVIDEIRAFGLTTPIVRHPSIALGTPEVTLYEHVYGYATFAAGGLAVTPVLIEKILDADGNVLEEDPKIDPVRRRRRIPADTAYVMVDLMKNVVDKGTGQKAKELGRPAAGKTGTSNDFKDNWFMAYTPDYVCGVWVGRDDFKSIGFDATGGTTAAPIWTDFMKVAEEGRPVRDFDVPKDVYFVRATPERGQPAGPGTPGAILIPFKRGTVPAAFARWEAKAGFGDDVF